MSFLTITTPVGVIPSVAVLQAERGISRIPPQLQEITLRHHESGALGIMSFLTITTPIGVIPSVAGLQAERGISRIPPQLQEITLRHQESGAQS